jgi:hypothetical protein
MSEFNLQKLLEFMRLRKDALQHQIDRDAGGGLMGRLEAWHEVKFWIEAIERGEFNNDKS